MQSSLSERAKRNKDHGYNDCLRMFNIWLTSKSILCLVATLATILLVFDSLSSQFPITTQITSLTPNDKDNAKTAPPHLESRTLPSSDPDRVCSQNPYITALNVSIPDVVASMNSWSVETHLAKIPQHPDNLLHTHARFFPFEPLAHCQSDKIHCVGGECKYDASKIVCGLDGVREKEQKIPNAIQNDQGVQAPPRCVVYSIGGNNKWSFEQDLLGRTPCDVHTFDCTGPITRFRKPNNPRLYFHHVCLGTQHEDSAVDCVGRSKCGETWTLLEMQQKLGHSRIDLFKMDIEGFEWPIFESWPLLSDTATSEGMLLPMQVLVEVHYQTQFAELRPPGVSMYSDFKSAADMVHLQSRFLQMGYVVVVRDDNRKCLHCTELTLIRVRCPERGVYIANA